MPIPADTWTWLEQDYHIMLTGTAGDQQHYEDIEGIVATVSKDAVKIWPLGRGTTSIPAKLWFEWQNIEKLTTIEEPH